MKFLSFCLLFDSFDVLQPTRNHRCSFLDLEWRHPMIRTVRLSRIFPFSDPSSSSSSKMSKTERNDKHNPKLKYMVKDTAAGIVQLFDMSRNL